MCQLVINPCSGNHERDWPRTGSFYGNTDSGGECGVLAETMFYVPAENRAKFWYRNICTLLNLISFPFICISMYLYEKWIAKFICISMYLYEKWIAKWLPFTYSCVFICFINKCISTSISLYVAYNITSILGLISRCARNLFKQYYFHFPGTPPIMACSASA